MKLSGKGIGWLIAGALICSSMTETDGIASAVGTLGIGLTFIAIYFIKQRFDPSGIGWFIAGGIVGSFSLEESLNLIYGFVSRIPVVKDDLSTIMIGLIITVGCFYMFYRSNKDALEYADFETTDDDEFSMPFQEEVFREDTVEVMTEEETPAAGDDGTVEIEISDGE